MHLTVPGPPFSPELVEAMNREELSAKGVEFLQEPEERPYGVEALCRDNSGNWIVLVEPREFSPSDFA